MQKWQSGKIDVMVDINLFNWVFEGTISILFIIGGWLCVMLFRAVVKNREDISAHKLHVAENFIRKDTFERVHDRIDKMSENIVDANEKISEIKSMMVQILHGMK